MGILECAYVIKSIKFNKYLGINPDSRYIAEFDTIRGSTLFSTRDSANECIEHFAKKEMQEMVDLGGSYNPLECFEPLEIIELKIETN